MPIVNLGSIENDLLSALPKKEYQNLLTRLEPVTLTLGEVLYRPTELIQYVYFPINSMVSLLTSVEGHQALEVGMVGHEGMLGVPLALGVNNSPVHALVQGTGMSMRMSAAIFKNELHQSISLQREVYRYIYELMVQITQSAACNRFHRVEARLARWLLMTRDRLLSNKFHLTQSLLSDMLGVRRVGVTQAAGILRDRKLISYSRGEICILDSNGLEATACHCYQIVKNIHQDTKFK
jgi:CRP-like cAMP-binding protein